MSPSFGMNVFLNNTNSRYTEEAVSGGLTENVFKVE